MICQSGEWLDQMMRPVGSVLDRKPIRLAEVYSESNATKLGGVSQVKSGPNYKASNISEKAIVRLRLRS